jgi:hypothetical protein
MSMAPGLERHRPKTVLVTAVFLFAATIVALVVGESLLVPNIFLDKLWKFNPEGAALFHSIGRFSSAFLLTLGVGTFFPSLGLLWGQRWAWRFGVTLFAIDACGNRQLLSYPRCAPFFHRRDHLCNIFSFLVPRFRPRLFSSPDADAEP